MSRSRGFSYLGWSLLLGSMLVGGAGTACGQIPRRLQVCEIQGEGPISPHLDREVVVRGLVSHSLGEGGDFTLLDVTCPLDGASSSGILVSREGGLVAVQVSDEVRLKGTVREVDGETRLEMLPGSLEILQVERSLPLPASLPSPFASPDGLAYESREGMLISIPSAALQVGVPRPGEDSAIPDFKLDPALGPVCFQAGAIAVRIESRGEDSVWAGAESGETLEDLTGLLRQDQGGYWLDLIREPVLKGAGIKTPAGSAESAVSAAADLGGRGKPSPTGTATSSPTPGPTPPPTSLPSPTTYPIQLLITEILPNSLSSEPAGEWFEIYNPSSTSLSLDGIKLGDELVPSGKEGLVRFPDGYRIGSKQVLVIANQARAFRSNYGFEPDFELEDSVPGVPDLLPYGPWGGSKVQLNNSADEAVLVSPWDEVLDLVLYGVDNRGGGMDPVPAPKEGHSLARYPPERDRDRPGDWREMDQPSPGWLDRSPPTLSASLTPSAALTQANALTPTSSLTPSLVCSPSPEPPTLSPTLIQSGTPTPGGAQSPQPTWQPSQTAAPSLSPSPQVPGTLAPTGTASEAQTDLPTLSATPTLEGRQTLTNTPLDALTPSPSLVDEGTLQPPATLSPPPSPSGTTVSGETPGPSLTPCKTGQASPTLAATEGGDPTTPAAATAQPTGSSSGLVVINEILADPDPVLGDSNGDGKVHWDDDEFIELVNLSGQELDLTGWQVFDSIRLRFTFPAQTVLGAGCGLVLFGGGDPLAVGGGSQTFTAGSLGLNNAGDEVILKDREGRVISLCAYGAEGGQDQSLARYPDLVGEPPLVLHGEIPGSGGALFSPGTRVDGFPFEGCSGQFK